MAAHLDDFVEQAQRLQDAAELKALFQRAVRAEGYENIGFVATSANQPIEIFWADFPDGFVETYLNERWERIDPVLQHATVTRRPFLWSDLVATRAMTSQQLAFLDQCRDIGVHSGLTLPFHSPGGVVHLFSISLRRGRPPDPRRIPYIYALAAQTWIRDSELRENSSPFPHGGVHLTARELECLKWAKEGKTNWEISCILAVTERTVEFHIGNVMKKLLATNRITAIVVALQRGLLRP